MKEQADFRKIGCGECLKSSLLGFDFSMAFQPIVNTATQTVYAQEALVRGVEGQGSAFVFANVNDSNRYRFDQACRVKAIKLAAELNIDSKLSINFMPNAVYKPELCIRTTLEAAEIYNFPIERIIFEVTEGEQINDHEHLQDIIQSYQQHGFSTAIDDFGAGYAGLNLLANMQTDLVKLDMALIRNIHNDKVRQSITRGIIAFCNDLDITVIAEGIESADELYVLQEMGIELFQGYYFAKPSFESLATVTSDWWR
ncbi:EAL domain-containing protein [Methylophaga sp.]|uniref:EAL domain-containing protein n=1 Tax=Methylophaga sp. TaxID=2024840 RepID=UPI00271BFA37|nr:EAL domain-containing protein [Methylophaga sp.]MDO8827136.1 EAL domain-containing protein [Methylophaga sp.]